MRQRLFFILLFAAAIALVAVVLASQFISLLL